MIPMPLSILHNGEPIKKDYYSVNGELLLSKGDILTEQQINALKKRKIETVYSIDEGLDNELKKILNADFSVMDRLNLEDVQDRIESDYSGGMNDPFLSNIKSGRDGFEQLISAKEILALDKKIEDSSGTDIPIGVPLRSRATEITSKDRDDKYKDLQINTYFEFVMNTKRLLNAVVNGEDVSGESIQVIVRRIIDIYLKDRNILLNLSSIKSDKSDYLFNHSLNVCILSVNIAASYGFNEQQVLEIGIGALLHDVGMLLVSESVRLKNNRLNGDELYEIHKHPMLGLHLLEKIHHLPITVPFIAYQTHERENGRGYPKQRSSRFIHNYAKVVAVADIYEAMSSPRTYREQNIPYKTMELLIKMTKQGLLASEFVKALLEYTSLFPVGSVVELNNGYIARVIKANGSSFVKPTVCVFADINGKKFGKNEIYEEDLSRNTMVQIVRAHAAVENDEIMLGF